MTSYRELFALLGNAQKPGYGSPPYSRWVNRRAGRSLAAAGFRMRLRPNQVTGISAAFTLIAVIAILTLEPSWVQGVVTAFLLLMGYAFDAADGQLARLMGGGSPAGEWLDHVVDAFKICLVHSATLIWIVRWDSGPRWHPLIALAFQGVASVFFFTFILNEKLRAQAGRPIRSVAVAMTRRRDMLQTLLATPTDYGILCLVFVLMGWPQGFFLWYSFLFAASAIVLVAALAKWWRELSGFSAG